MVVTASRPITFLLSDRVATMDDRMPFPSSWTVRRALDAYLTENGFTEAAYEADWTQASFLGVRFAVPNTRRHRWAIRLHDLHHVATGYGSDLAGEGEISAWEVHDARALGPYVGTIVVSGLVAGMMLAPRRTLAALRIGRAHRRLFALASESAQYESLLSMTVGELRELLGMRHTGLAERPRGLHAFAPGRA